MSTYFSYEYIFDIYVTLHNDIKDPEWEHNIKALQDVTLQPYSSIHFPQDNCPDGTSLLKIWLNYWSQMGQGLLHCQSKVRKVNGCQ